jgi:hypothetical protein
VLNLANNNGARDAERLAAEALKTMFANPTEL